LLSSLITLISFLLILSLLIFVHELGHFVVAKRAGITVEEFAIGFPPRLIKIWQDEGSITLDGQLYVIGRKVEVPRGITSGSQVYAETAVDEKGRATITKLAVVEELEEQDDSQKTRNIPQPLPQTVPADGRPTKLVNAFVRPTEYSLNVVPLGGYVRMVGEEDPTDPGSFASKSKRARFAVLIAGSLMNILTAVFFFSLTALAGVPEPTLGINEHGEEAIIAETIITDIEVGSPAESAGLKAGDKIIGGGGETFTFAGDAVEYVNNNVGQEIALQIERDGNSLTISVTPRINPPEGQGALGIRLTHDSDMEVVYYPVTEAVIKGVTDTATYVGLTFYIPYAIMTNIIPADIARPTGPVGIYTQTGAAVEATMTLDTWFPVLSIIAILSAALAVTNLLPLPGLDGGRIFFIIIEALRGKRVSPEKEGAVHLIGLAMLLMLMVVITFYDVKDPMPEIPWNTMFD